MYYRVLIDGKGLFTTLDSVLKEYEDSNNPQDIANYETISYLRGLLEINLNIPNNLPKGVLFAYTELGYVRNKQYLESLQECIEDFHHNFSILKITSLNNIVYNDLLQVAYL